MVVDCAPLQSVHVLLGWRSSLRIGQSFRLPKFVNPEYSKTHSMGRVSSDAKYAGYVLVESVKVLRTHPPAKSRRALLMTFPKVCVIIPHSSKLRVLVLPPTLEN